MNFMAYDREEGFQGEKSIVPNWMLLYVSEEFRK